MNYLPKRRPWARQQEALDKMAGAKVFALLMAMRTGKTKVLIDDFGRLELAGEVDDLLVIAPAGVYETWMAALEDHASQDLAKRLFSHIWRPGAASGVQRRRLEAFLASRDGPRALIIDVEAFSTVKAAKALALSFAGQRRCLGAVDESTTIKNCESARGDFVIEELAPLLSHRRILCGLPTPRSPLDLFGQFAFLDRSILGFENYKSFEARYAKIERVCMLPDHELRRKLIRVMGGQTRWDVPGVGVMSVSDLSRQRILAEIEVRNRTAGKNRVYVQTIPQLKGYQNEEELAKRIAPYSYRCLLSDCYDVPPKLYSFRDVEMTPEQRRVYEEFKKFSTAELESQVHVTAFHVVVKILKLHQILCGHVRDDEEGLIREVSENRTRAVCEILDEYDGKAIVWCSYDYNIHGVAKALEKKFGVGCVARFWGGNKNTREKEEKRFLSDPACLYMVATPAAGGKGRTWTNANLLIYHSSTNNLEHRAQSEERADGNLKEDRIACVDLRVKGTVDEKIIHALRAKIDMAAKITGDDWKQWLI